ncbi:ABC transporter permease [Ligilactobacillus ceti DSM 22408]|uniref:Energy-coupling factor transporter transmembrane protein EcfT n=2 Tax=Ligilactobacillus TaxID=2767887 RepID=A0A0R2KM47_9LACO|nr:ABC transporter permease [Ligilactobacillus ceti DSM 22408]
MDKILLGRYIKGNSLIHQLDPRLKIFLSFYFIGIIFLCNNWQTYGLLAALTLVCVWLTHVGIGFFVKGLRPLLWLILFTVVVQILFSTGGEVLWQLGFIKITDVGLKDAVFIFCRFVLIIFMSTLLTLTTTPLEIADGLESLMMPLKKLHVPVYEIALMLSIALRFIPLLMDETTKIMNAQRSRGLNFAEGNLLQKAKSVIPLLIPLFISSFNRAEELAYAMEARGYQGGEGRTKYRVQIWQGKDTVALILFGVITLALIWLRS